MTNGFCPSRAKALGRLPQTSAKPPVFEKGATSLLAIKTFTTADSAAHKPGKTQLYSSTFCRLRQQGAEDEK